LKVRYCNKKLFAALKLCSSAVSTEKLNAAAEMSIGDTNWSR